MEDEFRTSGTVGDVVTHSTKSEKSWVAAAVLNFFLGWLGIHRFYLGRIGSGVTMLLLQVIGWLTAGLIIGIPLMVFVDIWDLVDFIRIICNGLTDGEGKKLR